MPKKATTLFCYVMYRLVDDLKNTHTLYFRIHDATKSGILNWRIPPDWEFGHCVDGVSHDGTTDELADFRLVLQTHPRAGCCAYERVVYTRELRISEGYFSNLNRFKENHILTQEGPRAMYSQNREHWARDFFGFLGIEK